MSEEQNCYCCMFYISGECHRRINRIFIPKVDGEKINLAARDSDWATTQSGDWCGDFERRTPQGNAGY